MDLAHSNYDWYLFAPESPWFLVRKGRLEQAKHALERLLSQSEHIPDKSIISQSMLTKFK